MKRKLFALVSVLFFSFSINTFASAQVNTVVADIAKSVYEHIASPTVGAVGGEWTIIGLARSGEDIPESYYDKYYENVKGYVKEREGILHEKKYTEYSRVILALTAIGKNPADVDGYNLLTPLGDYNKTVWQGLNGSVWALIALDSGSYEMPENTGATVQASRAMYVQKILTSQNADGGWSLVESNASDIDITAMAVTALSKYTDDSNVKNAVDKAITYLSKVQNANGAFSDSETENAESCSQVLLALCTLGIDMNDDRFTKNGHSVLDGLLTFYNGKGGFNHVHDGAANQMATEQGLYALDAYIRALENMPSVFDMNDVKKSVDSAVNHTYGLPEKNADVKKCNIVADKTFSDISTHFSQRQIEALASRGIISGQGDNIFAPDATITRAEFATIIVKGLGLEISEIQKFDDVTRSDWFFGYVSTAYKYGIIQGVSETRFNPTGIITKEESAVMVSRAAKLCGLNNKYETFSIRDILSEYTDYVKAEEWSRESLAFCYDNNILSDEDTEIKPKAPATRAEIAVMLYNMLAIAKLL